MLMKAVEARKKAEVVHIHINKCRNTHTVHSIKRAEVIILWMDSCFLSFLCALSLHSFFFSKHLPSQKILALKHFSFECTAALG